MRKLILSLLYLVTAIWIGSIWTYMARTETHQYDFANIVKMSLDQSPGPFIHRRLAIDTAKLIVRVVPQATWSRASDTIDHSRVLRVLVRGNRMGWTRDTDPILISMTSVIMASALGFLIFARWLVHTLYLSPPNVAHAIALFLGLCLLGGRGNASAIWNNYPYDIPQSFMFLATATLIIRGNWLFVPMFLLASYSKETSVLLAFVYLLTWPKRGNVATVGTLLLFIAFVAIRFYVETAHHPRETMKIPPIPTALRNTMGILFYSIWGTPLVVLAGVMILKRWNEIPWQLKRMLFLPVVLFGACMFKGWIEERRAYLEAMPYVGMILIQVILWEAGKRGWMVPRNPHAPEFPTIEGARGFEPVMRTGT